jgi:anti-sigma factor RsiW
VVDEMACIELVERVTEYLEGALSPEELERLRTHLASCDGCRAHVEQVRGAVRVLEATPKEGLSARAEDELVEMFRGWVQGGDGR